MNIFKENLAIIDKGKNELEKPQIQEVSDFFFSKIDSNNQKTVINLYDDISSVASWKSCFLSVPFLDMCDDVVAHNGLLKRSGDTHKQFGTIKQ